MIEHPLFVRLFLHDHPEYIGDVGPGPHPVTGKTWSRLTGPAQLAYAKWYVRQMRADDPEARETLLRLLDEKWTDIEGLFTLKGLL